MTVYGREYGIKGTTYVALKSLQRAGSSPIIIPSTQDIVLDQRVEEAVSRAKSQTGDLVPVDIDQIAEDPLLSVTVENALGLEVLGMLLGVDWIAKTVDNYIIRELEPGFKEIPATTGVGFEGNGLPADPVATASALIDMQTVPLTRVLDSSFNPAGVRSFAIGANLRIRVTDDVAAYSKTFYVTEPNKSLIVQDDETPYTLFYMHAKFITKDRRLGDLYAPYTRVARAGLGAIPFGPGTFTVPFQALNNGRCRAFEVRFQPLSRAGCAASL